MLHVAQISFYMDPERRAPEQLLLDWPSLANVAEATARAGVRVSVIQACHFSRSLRRTVDYYFLPFGQATLGDQQAPVALQNLLSDLAPDVCHVHGLGFSRDVLALAEFLPDTPIVVQDHASRPPRWWRRRLWRKSFAVASAITFCAMEQAQPFVKARLIRSPTRVFEIPESTTRFTPGDQAEARQATSVTGDPLILWVGHLDSNKDPLTVLEGISAAAKILPRLELWCCFGDAPLLPAVQNRIATDPALRDRVHLLGRVAHERIALLMRAADVFVLGSHREGSGYSLIEALACALPPVVTDIPSFRALTGGGTVGALWPCGDANRLCEAIVEIANQPRSQMRSAVRAHFERELSSAALGRKMRAMYEQVASGAHGFALAAAENTPADDDATGSHAPDLPGAP